eukprot:Opistho-2@21171
MCLILDIHHRNFFVVLGDHEIGIVGVGPELVPDKHKKGKIDRFVEHIGEPRLLEGEEVHKNDHDDARKVHVEHQEQIELAEDLELLHGNGGLAAVLCSISEMLDGPRDGIDDTEAANEVNCVERSLPHAEASLATLFLARHNVGNVDKNLKRYHSHENAFFLCSQERLDKRPPRRDQRNNRKQKQNVEESEDIVHNAPCLVDVARVCDGVVLHPVGKVRDDLEEHEKCHENVELIRLLPVTAEVVDPDNVHHEENARKYKVNHGQRALPGGEIGDLFAIHIHLSEMDRHRHARGRLASSQRVAVDKVNVVLSLALVASECHFNCVVGGSADGDQVHKGLIGHPELGRGAEILFKESDKRRLGAVLGILAPRAIVEAADGHLRLHGLAASAPGAKQKAHQSRFVPRGLEVLNRELNAPSLLQPKLTHGDDGSLITRKIQSVFCGIHRDGQKGCQGERAAHYEHSRTGGTLGPRHLITLAG